MYEQHVEQCYLFVLFYDLKSAYSNLNQDLNVHSIDIVQARGTFFTDIALQCLYPFSIFVDMFNCYISFFPFWRKVAEVLKMRFMHWEKHIWLCAIQNIHRSILFCTIINPLFILREAGWLHKKTRNNFFWPFLAKEMPFEIPKNSYLQSFFARHMYLVRCRSTRLARPIQSVLALSH